MFRQVYDLARPYGRKKLAAVFGVVFLQGVFQVIGVTSIIPFLALASDPGQVRVSEMGGRLLAVLPEMSDRTLLIAAGLFAIAMLFLANGLLMLGEVVRVHYAEGLGHWLRQRLLARIADNPYGYFLQRNTGELLKKSVTDVQLMVRYVLLPALECTSRLLTVVLLLVTLLALDPLIATVSALGLGGFYAGIFGVLKRRRQHHSNRMKIANRGAIREAQQLLGGIKPIKVHQSENDFIARYRRHSAEQAALMKWMPVYRNTPRYLIEPLAFGGMVALIVVFAARGESLTTLLPKLAVMALAGYRMLPSLQIVYAMSSAVSLNRHTVEEVHEEFHESAAAPASICNSPPEPINWSRALRVEDLTFRYPGTAAPLFHGLSLEIRKNQFVALVGATGSGKSTLVDLLLGLHTPDAGVITVDDTSLTSDIVPAWRASLGYVPQDIFLLDDTIASNIAFGVPPGNIDLNRVAEVAGIAQIAGYIENELSGGYETQVGERGVRLSGGQRQRIGLARALYHDPSTLVLDEATSALDDTTESALMEAIEALHGEITLIVIAHRLSTIQRADHVFVLDHGQIIRQGTFDEVQGNDGILAPARAARQGETLLNIREGRAAS